MTLREALTRAAADLATDPELRNDANRDAELLMLHVLDVKRTALITESGRALTPVQQRAYESAVKRRMKHEPIQYIIGVQEFYGLALKVTPAVLIPRPETEHLVEAVLARVCAEDRVRIADVGTGSGAIAIALAKHLPCAEIVALDLASGALAVARENAQRHGVTQQIQFFESDLLDAVAGERFDVVVSNPPYVPLAEREQMHKQVREWEPGYALFAGTTGLEIYQRLVPQAWASLKPGGLLAMEIGYGQRDAIAALLEGWSEVSFVDDLQQIPRVALALKG